MTNRHLRNHFNHSAFAHGYESSHRQLSCNLVPENGFHRTFNVFLGYTHFQADRYSHIVQISLKQIHFWPRHGLQKTDGGFELRVGGADRQLQGASRKEVLNGFGQTIGDRETELIYLVSRDWFKGKFAGTHGLYHETAGFSGGFFTYTNFGMAVSSPNILT